MGPPPVPPPEQYDESDVAMHRSGAAPGGPVGGPAGAACHTGGLVGSGCHGEEVGVAGGAATGGAGGAGGGGGVVGVDWACGAGHWGWVGQSEAGGTDDWASWSNGDDMAQPRGATNGWVGAAGAVASSTGDPFGPKAERNARAARAKATVGVLRRRTADPCEGAGVEFTGWPPAALAWFDGLAAENTKVWFHANRPTYDEAVRRPFEDLIDDVMEEFGELRGVVPVPRHPLLEGQDALQDRRVRHEPTARRLGVVRAPRS